MSLVRRLTLLGCLLLCAAPAATIVSGIDTDNGVGGRFRIRGSEFDIEGSHTVAASLVGSIFAPGAQLSPETFSTDFDPGSGTFRGVIIQSCT